MRLFYTQEAEKRYPAYLEAILSSCEECYQIPEHVAALLGATKTPQGVFCVCKEQGIKRTLSQVRADGQLILLENIQDPANLGAVLRTAEALGIAGVVLCGTCCDCLAPKALRAGMGAVFRLPVYFSQNSVGAVQYLKQAGFAVFAAVPDCSAAKITSCHFERPCVVAIGNEGNGLTPELIDSCTQRVTIPMNGRAESLNAASSAAILMWEMVRGEGV